MQQFAGGSIRLAKKPVVSPQAQKQRAPNYSAKTTSFVTLQPNGSRIRKNSESPQFNSEWTEFLRIQLPFSNVTIWLKCYRFPNSPKIISAAVPRGFTRSRLSLFPAFFHAPKHRPADTGRSPPFDIRPFPLTPQSLPLFLGVARKWC